MNNPAKLIGRPKKMQDGQRIDVYLDAAAITRAKQIGGGNISAGIRKALFDYIINLTTS